MRLNPQVRDKINAVMVLIEDDFTALLEKAIAHASAEGNPFPDWFARHAICGLVDQTADYKINTCELDCTHRLAP